MVPAELVLRVAEARDNGAIASLRSAWTGSASADPAFERRMADWLAAEPDHRTTWLATLGATPVGMASLFEYRRMPRPAAPDSCWGYVGNVFVREDSRNAGIGSALLSAVVAAADERGYARLVLSPAPRALTFFERAGFIVPDETADRDRLLVRPGV